VLIHEAMNDDYIASTGGAIRKVAAYYAA